MNTRRRRNRIAVPFAVPTRGYLGRNRALLPQNDTQRGIKRRMVRPVARVLARPRPGTMAQPSVKEHSPSVRTAMTHARGLSFSTHRALHGGDLNNDLDLAPRFSRAAVALQA